MISSNNHPTLKASPKGEVWRGAYIIPTSETMALRTEHALLQASEIPTGDGTADHYDTRRQDAWMDDWMDADE